MNIESVGVLGFNLSAVVHLQSIAGVLGKIHEMNDTITPYLPLEIECAIFEIAARSARPCLAERINLLLVSKRTQHWVEPIIYRTSLCRYPGTGLDHLVPKESAPPVPSSKTHFIRHIYLVGAKEAEETSIRSMLLGCPNLTVLSLLTANGPCACLIFNLILGGNLPFLEHLSINMYMVPKELYSGPDIPRDLVAQVLGSLTHLELISDTPHSASSEMCSFLAHLPNLTHLNFLGFNNIPPSIVTTILSSSLAPKLKVFTMTKFHLEPLNTVKREHMDRYEEMGVDDIRLVCLKQQVMAYIQDYMTEACGTGIGAWKFVEDIIEERRKQSTGGGGLKIAGI
ncbi:hypothetical protein BDN72DRAFT_893205 [Pluteus cervinus]|uniref:Uncharacterized protein n=1 Tax=Pluteus cervinus TaxID=181527 RepID=A0ACD3B882_9AGAR|nr:hypothetical protein BDN72DRAFT_893205 [Pluteus cervinus]